MFNLPSTLGLLQGSVTKFPINIPQENYQLYQSIWQQVAKEINHIAVWWTLKLIAII